MHGSRNLFLLSGFFIVAGLVHFIIPQSYAAIMPPRIPFPLEMVYVSGVFESLGGIGVMIPRLRRLAGIGLIVLLIAVFPANVQMLANAVNNGASAFHITLLFLRLPLQPLMIVWVYRVAVSSNPDLQLPRTNL